nr:hypothetical protein [Planctomycetota bacterium]
PRKQTFTNTTSTLRKYDIYDGYFSDRSTSPGTPYVTPLTNFADSTGRFLVRTYSSVASTNQYALDFVSLEFGTDEIYEPADLIRTQTGTTTNYLSDLVGATYANLNASDDNKITIPQSGSANPADFYFTFKNVKAYTGANSLLISPEMCVSSSALIVTPYLYNFTTSTWTAITSAITPTTCATDTEYAWAVNSTTVSGFALSNYISSNREMRLRFLTNTPVAVYNLQLDRLYLMLGSINNDAAQCEVSWGTGTAGNCINTRDTMESKIATSTSSTWQTTATLEYPSSYYALDNDNDATNNEYAAAQNLSFPISLSSNTDISATHYAVKFRSNSVNQTMQLQVRDYSGLVGTSGWNNTLANETNANTIYSWADTWVNEEYRKDIDKIWQSSTSTMNMRMRTSAGNTTNPGTRDWDFALMSMRYLDANNQAPTVALVSLNSGNNITLTPNTTTPITITAVVADEQGYGDISSVQAKIFRSGLVNSYNCTNNDNNCYSIACSLSSCVSNSCLATCTVDFQFFAEPTDNGAYAISQNWNNQTWVARVEATDASGQKGASDNAYEESVEVNTLLAIDVNNLNYGSADPDTVSSEQTSTMITTGNVPVDVNLSGTDLVSGTNYIPVAQQKYNLTSSFNWGTQGTALSSTPTLLNLPSSKPTTTPSDASVNTYWRLRTPLFQKAGVYNGTNTVTAVEG